MASKRKRGFKRKERNSEVVVTLSKKKKKAKAKKERKSNNHDNTNNKKKDPCEYKETTASAFKPDLLCAVFLLLMSAAIN